MQRWQRRQREGGRRAATGRWGEASAGSCGGGAAAAAGPDRAGRAPVAAAEAASRFADPAQVRQGRPGPELWASSPLPQSVSPCLLPFHRRSASQTPAGPEPELTLERVLGPLARGGRRLVSGDLERAPGGGRGGRGGRLRTRCLQARGGGAPCTCRAQTFRAHGSPELGASRALKPPVSPFSAGSDFSAWLPPSIGGPLSPGPNSCRPGT